MTPEATEARDPAELARENKELTELAGTLLARLAMARQELSETLRRQAERTSRLRQQSKSFGLFMFGVGIVYGAVFAGNPFER